MTRRRTLLAALITLCLAAPTVPLALGLGAGAAPTVEGNEWRELYTTTGLSHAQVATVCPIDGATPCAGTVAGLDLSGWVWATAPQVRALLDDYAPALASAEPPTITGLEGFAGASGLLGVMRWTTYTALTYFYSEYTSGWTASVDGAGSPIAAGAQFATSLTGGTTSGSIGLGAEVDSASPNRGVWLWRPVGGFPPPAPQPLVEETAAPETPEPIVEEPTIPEATIPEATIPAPTAPEPVLPAVQMCGGLVATIIGTDGDDTITGTQGDDVIVGLGGSDQIDGLGGRDTICAGDGSDFVRGGSGDDTVDGGDGGDQIYGDDGADVLGGGAGIDAIRGGSGKDRCSSGELRMASCAVATP